MRLARQNVKGFDFSDHQLDENDLFRSSAIHFVELLVSKSMAVPIKSLYSKGRGTASVAFARQTAMYLAHIGLGYSLSEVGFAYGRDRSTVMHACRRIEDERDDPSFDALLDVLELELLNWRKHWDALNM